MLRVMLKLDCQIFDTCKKNHRKIFEFALRQDLINIYMCIVGTVAVNLLILLRTSKLFENEMG